MKNLSRILMALLVSVCASTASAADEIASFPIANALAGEKAKALLGDSIKFYYGDQEVGVTPTETLQRTVTKKTNGTNKTNQEACDWAFLSALIDLRDAAKSNGSKLVVNVRSSYKGNTTSSTETYTCSSGMLMSSVSLVGDVVLKSN